MLEKWLKLKSVMQFGDDSTAFSTTHLQPDMVSLFPINCSWFGLSVDM
jgi:hypothetical protein